MARPALRVQALDYVRGHYGISLRWACHLVQVSRSTPYYERCKDPRPELRRRMRELANTRLRWVYRRLQVLLRREGWRLGRSQCYRIYGEEQLQLRSKLPKKRKMLVQRRQRTLPTAPGAMPGRWTSWPRSSAMAVVPHPDRGRRLHA